MARYVRSVAIGDRSGWTAGRTSPAPGLASAPSLSPPTAPARRSRRWSHPNARQRAAGV